MDTIKTSMGLVLVYMAAKDIYDSVDSDIESIRALASELNKLKEIIVVNSIVKDEDILSNKKIDYNDMYPLGYSTEYDTRAKSILRNIVKRLHLFIGAPGGKVSSMNISKVSAVSIINRTSSFLLTAGRYLQNKENIERWRKNGRLH